MQLFKTLLAGAALVASAAASGEGRLRFTSFSQSVAVGDPVALTWTGGVEGPVSIKLRKGASIDLQDIAVLTGSGIGGSYTWVPESTLPEAEDYALEISQGDDVNYTGLFFIEGGPADDSSTTTTSGPTATETTTDFTATETVTGDATTITDTVTSTAGPSSVSPSFLTTPPSVTPSSSLVTSKSTASSTASDTVNASGTGSTAPIATGGASSLASPFTLALGIVAAVVYLI